VLAVVHLSKTQMTYRLELCREEFTPPVTKEKETRTTTCARQIDHKGPHMDENELSWK
jgi:hypothetical protein